MWQKLKAIWLMFWSPLWLRWKLRIVEKEMIRIMNTGSVVEIQQAAMQYRSLGIAFDNERIIQEADRMYENADVLVRNRKF